MAVLALGLALAKMSLTEFRSQTYNGAYYVRSLWSNGYHMSEKATVPLVEQVSSRALQELEAAAGLEELEQCRVTYLGRAGRLTQVLRGLSSLSPDERRQVGAAANQAKTLLEESLAGRQRALREAHLASTVQQEAIDVTLPGWPAPEGGLHVITPDGTGDLRHLHVHGLRHSRGAGGRVGPLQLRDAEHTQRPPRTGYVEHPVGRLHRRGRPTSDASAYAYVTNAGPIHGGQPATGPRRRAGQGLPLRGPPTPPTSGTSTRSRGWRLTRASPSPT